MSKQRNTEIVAFHKYRFDSRKGRVDMWFIVAQFLVVHAFRGPVISSSFQFVQFGMVMTFIKRCRLRKIRWLRCFYMVVERA